MNKVQVYDPEFLIETRRAFAKWELAEKMIIPARNVVSGQEETVAETMDKNGVVVGRWVVQWGDNGEGTCREVGDVIR